MNKKIKFLIDLFVIIVSLYIWYIFYYLYYFYWCFHCFIKKKYMVFISSIIIVILLIFIDRKSSMKEKWRKELLEFVLNAINIFILMKNMK